MRELFEDMPIITSIITLLFLFIIFVIVDIIFVKPEPFTGIVVDKHYKAETTGTGTGYVYGSGNGMVITTTTHESEKFLIMVRTESGQVVTVDGTATVYYEKEIGQNIDCFAYKGLITNLTWSLKSK